MPAERLPFGAELRRRRVEAGISLDGLARRVHYSKGHLSKVESGQKRPSDGLARLCDAELDAQGALIALTPARQSTPDTPDQSAPDIEDETWVIALGARGGHVVPAPGGTAPPVAAALGLTLDARVRVDVGAAYPAFFRRFAEVRDLGQVSGPTAVFPLVMLETKTLQMLAHNSPPDDHRMLLRLAARYAEFAGWLAQEAGDDRLAWWLTVRAVGMAEAAGDPALRAYALVRRADIALHQDDALSVIELGIRGQCGDDVPVRIRGLAAQREAQGRALIGDHTACLRALDRSAEFLAEAAATEQAGPPLGSARTPDLVTLVRGWCLHELGRSADAATVLDAGVAQFGPGAHRARVRYQARAALAHAAAGSVDRACELTASLLGQARILDSATIRHDLRSLARLLGRWRAQPLVGAVLPALAEVLRENRTALAVDLLNPN